MGRRCMTIFREAGKPLTMSGIVAAMIEKKGLDPKNAVQARTIHDALRDRLLVLTKRGVILVERSGKQRSYRLP